MRFKGISTARLQVSSTCFDSYSNTLKEAATVITQKKKTEEAKRDNEKKTRKKKKKTQ